MKIIGRLICYFLGHRRGRMVAHIAGGMVEYPKDGIAEKLAATKSYECPRCGRIKTRKVKAA